FAAGFSVVSVSATCIVKGYGARWVLQVTQGITPVIPSVSRGIPVRELKGIFLGIPRLTLGMTGKSMCIVGFHTVLAQFFAKRGEMFAITGFDRAKNVDGRDIGAGEGAIVHYLFDAGFAG